MSAGAASVMVGRMSGPIRATELTGIPAEAGTITVCGL